jgi:hypothetical protein
MPPYKELFPVGSTVKIGPREQLEGFQRTWKHHNPDRLKSSRAVCVGFVDGDLESVFLAERGEQL